MIDNNGNVICKRCKRIVHPWLLKRADVCSGRDWAYCIRQIADVLR